MTVIMYHNDLLPQNTVGLFQVLFRRKNEYVRTVLIKSIQGRRGLVGNFKLLNSPRARRAAAGPRPYSVTVTVLLLYSRLVQ